MDEAIFKRRNSSHAATALYQGKAAHGILWAQLFDHGLSWILYELCNGSSYDFQTINATFYYAFVHIMMIVEGKSSILEPDEGAIYWRSSEPIFSKENV